MPQLSIETYVSQYIWLVVLLGVFYYYIATQIVPKIGEIKKTRAQIAVETPANTAIISSSSQNIQLGLLYTLNKMGDNKVGQLFDNMNQMWVSSYK
jgi:hypothetical protein